MAHTVIGAQPDKAAQIDAELRHVFPQAETWTFKDRESPHFRGYVGVGEERDLVGLAFVTTDITCTNGYKGPIPILVGMKLDVTVTRILLFYHREPFGYFSIDLQAFSDQFENKSVLDPLIVGEDVDAITRATVTSKPRHAGSGRAPASWCGSFWRNARNESAHARAGCVPPGQLSDRCTGPRPPASVRTDATVRRTNALAR